MESSIFKFVLKYSKKQQIKLLVLTLLSFPFLYYSLDLPKTIINEAIGGSDFPRSFFEMELEQIPYLLVLCSIFLVLVFVNGGFKYFINVYRGVVGERMLRRLRYDLIARVLRFPLPHFRRMSQGEIVSMVTAETEPLGGFIGDSFALPAFQGGTLLTILVFMFIQDWVLGLAAIALYPLQTYLIPKLQRRLNQYRRQRVVKVRKLSEGIGELVSGAQEVHAHDTSRFELAGFSRQLGDIYQIRYRIYLLKFFIKFINNFIAQLTPFFFYSIGGYLVITGELTFGALVAVLAAYKDLAGPWKELLDFYQLKEDARIKYELLADSFQPLGMLDEQMQTADPKNFQPLSGDVIATNLNLREDESDTAFGGGATFQFGLPQRVAVAGVSGSGKDRLASILAGLSKPLGGSISIGGVPLTELPETVTGRRIAYVGQESRLRSGSLGENLFYSLKHQPQHAAEYEGDALKQHEKELTEARLSGNSEYDINADWIDYEAAGAVAPGELLNRAVEVLRLVDMDEDVYKLGIRGTIDIEKRPDLAQRFLEARVALRDRLEDPEIAPLVELFDSEKYNTNMTVAENLLFGTPRDATFDIENLAQNEYVRRLLSETGLTKDFLIAGRRVAELMVELFADVAPGSELFEQFSFISADDLPAFRNVLARTAEEDVDGWTPDDRIMLLSLPFKLSPARHRLGLIDSQLRVRILEARRAFAEGVGGESSAVEFFDPDRYNSSISIQDNILFGRLAYGKARSAPQVGRLIREIVEKLNLRRVIMEVGLDYSVGIGGMRLSATLRQKLVLARAVLKRPDLLVIDEATSSLDGPSQDKIMANLLKELDGRGLIWVLHRASLAERFDYAMMLEGGRVVEQGRFQDLDKPGSIFNQLATAG